MIGITTYLSILALNVNGLNSPIKSYLCQTGLKKKTQQSAVYMRPFSLTDNTPWLRLKSWKEPMAPENKQELQYLYQTK
jgi:hypothetical protein